MIEIRNRQLYVNNSLFIVRGGELQNSSMSSSTHMKPIWNKLKNCNLNTVLGAVTWDQIEPEEGKFDFKELDICIKDARSAGLKLILLWFGAFKNGMSSYAPAWVKRDPKRFPRVLLKQSSGQLEYTEVLSILNEGETKSADANAFCNLISHIRKVDEKHSTVIMIQCENEVGILNDSMDRNPSSIEKFQGPVPIELLNFVKDEWSTLHPLFKEKFSKPSEEVKNTWEGVFGSSIYTEELFMSYYYSKYIDYVASCGRKEYNIPIFTNVWQNQHGKNGAAAGGGKPGQYPSGGAVGGVLDIWIKFTPNIDFISPDIYLNDYDERCQWYSHKNQPLFIPEQRRDEYGARRMWKAIGEYKAIGACPFGIDTLSEDENPWKHHYKLLSDVEPLIKKAYEENHPITGLFFDEYDPESISEDIINYTFPNYIATITRCRVYGTPDAAYGLIINDGEDSFTLVGCGYQVVFSSRDNRLLTGISRVQEVSFEGGKHQTLRWMNGDETQSGSCVMMPSDNPDYGDFPVAITISAGTKIAQVKLYEIPRFEIEV